MYILFAISILCFFALVLAAIAIARHVRSRHVPTCPQTRSLASACLRKAYRENELEPCVEPTLADTRNQSISSKRF